MTETVAEGLTRNEFSKAAALTPLILPALLSCSPKGEPQYRSKEDAIWATRVSRAWHDFLQRKEGRVESDLEGILKTDHFESPVGIVNGMLWEPGEKEGLDLPSRTTFATKPWDFVFEHNGQLVPAFANSMNGLAFRQGGPYDGLTRMFDRTVWTAHKGGRVTAILETDEATEEQIEDITRVLAYYGIGNIIVSNEPNAQEAPWLDKPEVIYKFLKIVKETHEGLRVRNSQTSSPGFPHWGDGHDEQRYLRVWNKLGDGRLPIDRFAAHIYGSTEGLLPRGGMLRRVLNSEGGSGVKLDCTELGPPNFSQPTNDLEYTLGNLSPRLILALSSTLFDSVDIYALLDSNPKFSLAQISGHNLVPKASYLAAKNIGKFFANVTHKELDTSNQNYFQTNLKRSDGIEGRIYMSRTYREVVLPKEKGALVYNVFGKKIEDDSQLVLPPREREEFSGEPRIVILR